MYKRIKKNRSSSPSVKKPFTKVCVIFSRVVLVLVIKMFKVQFVKHIRNRGTKYCGHNNKISLSQVHGLNRDHSKFL